MIIVMKPGANEAAVQTAIHIVKENGLSTHLSRGEETTIIGVVGDKNKLDRSAILSLPDVERLVNITESYKLANKRFHPDPTEIRVKHTIFGPGHRAVIAGPGAVESSEQILGAARSAAAGGATMLFGGAFAPRTSPYAFQGLAEKGLFYLREASDTEGLDCICEVTSPQTLSQAQAYVDMVLIGPGNMQNFELLKEAGRSPLPVVLKRGLSATIDEWLNAAEYIMASGNPNVVLCEQGIRTFETATKNTLDLSAVCILREKTHLPVIVDPSRACGIRSCIAPLSRAAIACGADGLMILMHPNPALALSDGDQSLNPIQFANLMESI